MEKESCDEEHSRRGEQLVGDQLDLRDAFRDLEEAEKGKGDGEKIRCLLVQRPAVVSHAETLATDGLPRKQGMAGRRSGGYRTGTMKPLALLLPLALAVSACAPVSRSSQRPLQFLLVNDVYVGDTLKTGLGGLARVARLKQELERDGPVLFMLAGDFLSPSLLTRWYDGRQMIEMFNAARLDYATFGNHEFDISADSLTRFIADSRFRWTSANCFRTDGSRFPGVSPWDTLTVEGRRIGIFGVTLVDQYPRARCTSPDSAAVAAVRTLKAANAEIIIGLTHLSRAEDSVILAANPAIDFILGGHEHDWQRVTIGDRHVLKADQNSESAQLMVVPHGGAPRSHRLIVVDARLQHDPVTEAVVRRWQDSATKRVGPEVVVGTVRAPLEARSQIQRRNETALGNLVADAFRHRMKTDVALVNSGTLRLDDVIQPGPLTNHAIRTLLPFPDMTPVVAFPLTGARLREMLEHSVSRPGHGAFLQVSGIRFTWDPALPQGKRLVGDVLRADGRAIGAEETVSVAFPTYPSCEGGDGYVIPEAAEACTLRATAPRAPDILIDYIATILKGEVTAPPLGRINRVPK